jgi:hypothetical protein
LSQCGNEYHLLHAPTRAKYHGRGEALDRLLHGLSGIAMFAVHINEAVYYLHVFSSFFLDLASVDKRASKPREKARSLFGTSPRAVTSYSLSQKKKKKKVVLGSCATIRANTSAYTSFPRSKLLPPVPHA